MKDKLLSIGEVSRMKGVSPKSLRYYEQLGILAPARTDERSGYRYYALSQMILVDVIITCVELGIPLKTLTDYMNEDGLLDIASLLERGRKTALENIRKARASLAQIDSYLNEAAEQKELKSKGSPYLRSIPCRTILEIRWHEPTFDAKRYLMLTTSLYNRAAQLDTVPLYQWGVMRKAIAEGGTWSVFVEVALEDPERPRMPFFDKETGRTIFVSSIPDGTCRGKRLHGSSFERCFHDVFDIAASIDGAIIATEVWDDEVDPENYVVEFLERL